MATNPLRFTKEFVSKCLNIENLKQVYNSSLNVIFSLIESTRFKRKYAEWLNSYNKPSIEVWLASLYTSIDTKIESDEMELDFDSFYKALKRNVNWGPLVQGLYDEYDSSPHNIGNPRQSEIPEHIKILALFQLIWNGSITFVDESEYPNITEQFVRQYIEQNISCSAPEESYKFNPQQFEVKENILVTDEYQPRVYFFAPDYSRLDNTQYHPSNILNGYLNRRYNRTYGPPPLIRIDGKIVHKDFEDAVLRETKTFKQFKPKIVSVLIDGYTEPFKYDISQLYLSETQTRVRLEKKNIFKQPPDSRKFNPYGGSAKKKQNKKSQRKRNIKKKTQRKYKK